MSPSPADPGAPNTPSAPGARLHLGAARVRRLRAAAVAAAGIMTVAAVVLFLATLELGRDLPATNPYSDIYLLVAGAGPLAVLLHGLGVLVVRRHTDHDTLDPTGRARILGGGLACTLLAAAATLLTPLVTPPPFTGHAWITVPSLALTLLLTVTSLVALQAGSAGRVPR